MKNLRNAITRQCLPLFFLLLLCTQQAVGAEGGPEIVKAPAGLSHEEALRLGEAMYRKGLLPSGEPMTGFVQGDIEVKGPILTCANCHMRSGLGSYEGGVTTLPTNGEKLFSPLTNGYDLPSTSMGYRLPWMSATCDKREKEQQRNHLRKGRHWDTHILALAPNASVQRTGLQWW